MTIDVMALANPLATPAEVRKLCRNNALPTTGTPGYAEGFAQANLLILPKKYADDFRTFCLRNPVPCPLIGETSPGDVLAPASLAQGCDLRTDVAFYSVYKDGRMVTHCTDACEWWSEDTVTFLIGCSYTFETALVGAGLKLRHTELGRSAPVYQTTVPLMSAGVFSGFMAVSMRPYPASAIPLIQKLCRPFTLAHGEPVAWGEEGARRLGITDVDGQNPDWGDPTVMKNGEIPVYWGCGVTPQIVVMEAKLPEVVVSHKAGYMLVLDIPCEQLCV